MAAHRTVLIAGTQGVIGRAAAGYLAMQADTKVYGLSRRTGVELAGVEEISVDLLQPNDTHSKLGAISNVTHIVFGAYV